jgi:DNA-binding transcriptional LysR family regulator
MEMSQVRYFLALCKERNFTRAAQHCGVAQPSLTQSIKSLETELGGPLFVRRHKGTELTELGRRAEPYFAAIDHCVNEIMQVPHRASAPDHGQANDVVRRLGLR